MSMVEQELVVDPRTGDVLEALPKVDHERLAEVLLALKDREAQVHGWRLLVEDELARRHGDLRDPALIGAYTVRVDAGMTRRWDAEDLESAVVDLVGRGVLDAREAAGLFRREVKVDGRKAAQLMARADGEALVALRNCFRWERAKRPRVSVEHTPQLFAAEE